MKIQFLNSISLKVISGGNIYNQQIKKGLQEKGHQVDYNITAINKNYDLTIVDSLFLNDYGAEAIKNQQRIYVLIHQIPELTNDDLSFLKSNAQFIVTGFPVKDELKEKWQLDIDKIHLVRPGVSDNLKPKGSGLIKVKRVILNSNFIKRKQLELLIPLTQKMNHPNVQFHVIGNPDIDKEYADKLKIRLKNELKNQISFHFNQTTKEVFSFLNEADLFLSLSKHETFGMAIFEALSLNLLCLCFETGDLPLFKSYKNYFGIPMNAIDKMSEVLSDWCENGVQVSEMNHPLRYWNYVNDEFESVINP